MYLHDRRPLITIGMAVRNCQSTLSAAIQSLLLQTCPDWELVLIDDGSSDNTLSLIQEYRDSRIRAFAEGAHRGLPARLNQALAVSQGRYFARMDADDIAYPSRFERQINYLESHSEVDLIGSSVLVFCKDGIPLGKRDGPELHTAICRRPWSGFPIAHPTYMGKLEWFQRFLYNEKMVRSQDQDLLLRAYQLSRFANIPEILLGYREDKIRLPKTLWGRWLFARSSVITFARQGRPLLGVIGMFEQIVKAGGDVLAVYSGLNYRLLRHRALPISQEEQHAWFEVWQLVNSRVSQAATSDIKKQGRKG